MEIVKPLITSNTDLVGKEPESESKRVRRYKGKHYSLASRSEMTCDCSNIHYLGKWNE